MDYKEKYIAALERAKKLQETCDSQAVVGWCEYIFPELKDSEDERMRKEFCKDIRTFIPNEKANKYIAWIEKQGNKIVDCQQNHQDVKYPNGGIVIEDFNGGEGFYKLHLDYLSKKQVEEVEKMVKTWNKESKASDENIKNCIGMCLTDANEQRFEDYGTTLKDCLAWLKKQGKKQSLWTDSDRTMAFTLMRDVDQMTYISNEVKNERLQWLNSLEDRFNNGK